jgi:LysM repeat protein
MLWINKENVQNISILVGAFFKSLGKLDKSWKIIIGTVLIILSSGYFLDKAQLVAKHSSTLVEKITPLVYQGKLTGVVESKKNKKIRRKPLGKVNVYKIYFVKEGDTLSELSTTYNISMDRLEKDNSINRRDILRIGERLRIHRGN